MSGGAVVEKEAARAKHVSCFKLMIGPPPLTFIYLKPRGNNRLRRLLFSSFSPVSSVLKRNRRLAYEIVSIYSSLPFCLGPCAAGLEGKGRAIRWAFVIQRRCDRGGGGRDPGAAGAD